MRRGVAFESGHAVLAESVESTLNSGATGSPSPAITLTGYDREALEALPPDAVVNSFGCGNPLAFGDVKEGDVVLDWGSGAGIETTNDYRTVELHVSAGAPIPTVSEWGMIAMTLLLVAAGTGVLRRRRLTQA